MNKIIAVLEGALMIMFIIVLRINLPSSDTVLLSALILSIYFLGSFAEILLNDLANPEPNYKKINEVRYGKK